MITAGQWTASVMARRTAGEYSVVTLSAAGSAAAARPGQYASLRVGGAESSRLLRRALWIREATAGGRHGGTLDVVADVREPGGAWLAAQPESAPVDILAPLGRPFLLPRETVTCLLVGFGVATAPLIRLAEDLVSRGSRVRFLMLGDRAAFGVLGARRFSAEVIDRAGTGADLPQTVADILADGADVVYSAGSAAELRDVAEGLAGTQVPHQAAIHSPLVCGSGTCTACAIPLTGRDSVTRMVRVCSEGPVFNADLVRWADLGTVPGDCLGASGEQQ